MSMLYRPYRCASLAIGVMASLLAGTAPFGMAYANDSAAARAGSLRRVLASSDQALDVYRLALLELVPAARRALETGRKPGATPDTPVPEPASEVFSRLAASIPSRIGSDSLTPIARAYHVEVLEALDQLAVAERLAEVPPPYQALVTALEGAVAHGGLLVDIFSRQRPILARVYDPNTAVAQIHEALDELNEAERRIVKLRRRGGTLGTQLQAFLGLEIALGNTLDLIASAQEAGVHIGFEVQLSTTGFAVRLATVRAAVATLRGLANAMAAPPAPIPPPLRAYLLEARDGSGPRVELWWSAPDPQQTAGAAVLVRKRANRPALTERLARAYRCEGASLTVATQKARQRLQDVNDEPTLVARIEPTVGVYADRLTELPVAPPAYQVVPVSSFGVQGEGPDATAVYIPTDLHGPDLVLAEALQPELTSASFYRDVDAVRVTWHPSPNDFSAPATAAASRALAAERGLAVVRAYKIYRIDPVDNPTEIGTVPAGATAYVDHVQEQELAAGVRYGVVAVDAQGASARGSQDCGVSATVQLDVRPRLALASQGLAAVRYPTRLEMRRRRQLQNPGALSAAVNAFGQRPAEEQARLLQQWWLQTPETQRRAWLAQWGHYFGPSGRQAWLDEASAYLGLRDLQKAQAAVYILEHPEMEAEVERWWSLLDEASRRRATQRWRGRLNLAHRQWLDAELRAVDAPEQRHLLWPARLLAWWTSRDRPEQDKLAQWWKRLPREVVVERLRQWLEASPEPAKLAVRWPDWRQLTPEEKGDRLENGFQDLPTGLWHLPMAWLAWQELSLDAKVEATRDEIGVLGVLRAKARYWTRPLDRRLDFRLAQTVSWSGLAVAALVVLGLWRRWRRKARADVVDGLL